MFLKSFAFFMVTLTAIVVHAEPISLGKGSQPRIVSDGAKRVAVIFGRPGEIVIATSADGGATFGPTRILSPARGMPLGMRRGPRAAMSAKTMVVTAIAGEKGNGQDGDLWAWTSSDDGKTWKRSRKPLNTVSGSAREGLHGLGSNRAGMVACVWLDLRNAPKNRSGAEVWMSLSKDGGMTWEKDRIVYRQEGGSVCECCHPSLVIDDANIIYVMFRNSKDGARDMYLTSSRDDGKTFDEPKKLGRGTWPLNACPMDGGDFTLDAKGNVQTAWMRNGKVFSAVPDSGEKELGKGRQPVVVVTSKGAWTAWTDGNTLMGKWPDAAPKRLSDDAGFPSAVGLDDGAVGVVWEQKQEVLFDLLRQP